MKATALHVPLAVTVPVAAKMDSDSPMREGLLGNGAGGWREAQAVHAVEGRRAVASPVPSSLHVLCHLIHWCWNKLQRAGRKTPGTHGRRPLHNFIMMQEEPQVSYTKATGNCVHIAGAGPAATSCWIACQFHGQGVPTVMKTHTDNSTLVPQ